MPVTRLKVSEIENVKIILQINHYLVLLGISSFMEYILLKLCMCIVLHYLYYGNK